MATTASQRNRCPSLPTVCLECTGPIEGSVVWDRIVPEMVRERRSDGTHMSRSVIVGLCSTDCRHKRRERLLGEAVRRREGKPSP